jgi:uncharacterized protein YoaH (UPF0181 family)
MNGSLTLMVHTDGLISPKSVTPARTRSNSRVRFDLDSNVEFPHEQQRARASSHSHHSRSDSEDTITSLHQKDDDHHRPRRRGRARRHRDPASQLFNDPYDRPPHDSDSDSGTVELPRRFDEHGNRKHESFGGDDLAERLQELLSGRVSAGNFFRGIAGSLRDEGSGDGRSRSRRRRDTE